MRWDKTGKVVEKFYVVGHPVMPVKEREWDPKSGPKQIESAYLLNTRVRVRCLKERMGASALWSSG